jgi:hypothetical protein
MFEGIDATLRPLGVWPGPVTAERKPSPFRASWRDTVKLLDRELWHLDAQDLVLQLDYQERDIRKDGMPRADARMGGPGVIISFQSKHGPLRYPCDAFTDWRDNVRAIALALEALRRVDRYGITRRAEQYAGWKALPSSTQPVMTTAQAAAWIGGLTAVQPRAILDSPQLARETVRMAASRTHPDAGGDASDFARVQEAKRVLSTHHGVTL